MTAAECLEHKWLKVPDETPSSSSPAAAAAAISSPVPSASSPLVPRCRVPSVSDSPSGQRRALASTLTDDDDVMSLREPAKKCRCDVDLKQQQQQQQPPADHHPRPDSSKDKENRADDVEQRLSTTSPKFDCASETSSSSSPSHCSSSSTVGVVKTLVGGACIDISVA